MNIQHENGDSSQKSAATVFNNAFLKGNSRPLYLGTALQKWIMHKNGY
ncbi:hypothetical protein [Limosilactobacillus frumenti]|nr:hypothetical protein [Limosilactobacillus frumenti]